MKLPPTLFASHPAPWVTPLSRVLASFALLSLLAIVPVNPAHADTAESTWTGGTSTDWNNAGNWSNGITTSSTVSAVFNAPFTNQPTTTGATTVEGIWVTDIGGTPAGVSGTTVITNPGGLTVTGTGTLDSNANAGILLDGAGNSSLTITGNTTLNNGSSILVNNAGTLGFGTLACAAAGNITIGGTGSGTINIGAVAAQGNSITYNFAGTINITGGSGGGTSNTQDSGTINVTGGSITKAFTVNGGTLNLNTANAFNSASLFTVAAGTANISQNNTMGAGATIKNCTVVLGANNALGTNLINLGATSSTTTLQSSVDGVTISNPISYGGSITALLTISGGHSLTFGGNFTAGTATNTSHTITVNNTATTAFTGADFFLAGGAAGSHATITFQGSGNVTIGDVIEDSNGISGAVGSVLLLDTGTNIFSGANTYTGTTTLGSANGANAGTLRLSGVGVISDAATTVFGGTFDLNGLTQTITSLTLGGGASGSTATVSIGAGALTLGGDVTFSATDNPNGATISGVGGGVLNLNATRNFTVGHSTADTGTTPDLTVSAIIQDGSASSGLNKAGAGTLLLSGANTFTGATSISAGTLSISSLNSVNGGTPLLAGSSLGAPTTIANGTIAIGATTVAGTLLYTGGGETTDRVINLAGTTGGATIDQSGSGLLKFTSALTATGAGIKTLTLQGSTAGTGEINGAIVDDTGTNKTSLTKLGTGTWVLSAANSYTGTTSVNVGTLTISSLGTLGAATAPLTMGGGTLDLGTTSQTVGAVSITTAAASGNTIQNGSLTGASYAASNTTGNAIVTANLLANGSAGLAKTGAGTLTLAGANTFAGATTLSTGTLALTNVNGLADSAPALSSGVTLSLLSDSDATFNTGAITVPTSSSTVNFNVDNVNAGNTNHTLALGAPSMTYTITSSNQTDTFNVTGSSDGYTLVLPAMTNNVNGAGYAVKFNANGANLAITSLNNANTTGGRLCTYTFGGTGNISVGNFTQAGGGLNGITVNMASSTPTVTLTGASNSFNGGGLTMTAGTLIFGNTFAAANATGLSAAGAIAGGTIDNQTGSAVTIGAAETWAISGNFTFGSGSTTGSLNLGTGAVTLTNNPQITVAANTLTIGGAIGGTSQSLSKLGAGTLIDSAASTYTGATTVAAGTLIVSGSLNGSAAVSATTGGTLTLQSGLIDTAGTVTVASTSALTGKGTVGTLSVLAGGTFAPGVVGSAGSGGVITTASNSAFATGAAFSLQVSGTSAGQYGQLAASGKTVSLSGSTQLTITLGTGYAGVAAAGDTFTLINGAGNAVAQNFYSGSTQLTQGATFSADGLSWEISYDGALGNDSASSNNVDLEVLGAVPEPGTWAMLLCGLGVLVHIQRRRRQMPG